MRAPLKTALASCAPSINIIIIIIIIIIFVLFLKNETLPLPFFKIHALIFLHAVHRVIPTI